MGSILVDFERKIEKQQYISTALFGRIQKRAPRRFIRQFDLDRYNDEVLSAEYLKYSGFFDPNLTENQVKAILADEERKLIVANTDDCDAIIAAEIKHLMENKKVAPKDILVIRNRQDVAYPCALTNPQILGRRYIQQVLRYKSYRIVTEKERDRIFLKFLKKRILTSYGKIEDLIECFSEGATGQKGLVGGFFRKHYGRFKSFDDYFDSYVEARIAEIGDAESGLKRQIRAGTNADAPRTLLGEQVKTRDEAIIANWLFRHSIDYQYARPYDEPLPDMDGYRPDFTLRIGGQKIYIDYYGTSASGTKADFHRKNRTHFIALRHEPNAGFLRTLQRELEELGVRLPRERNAKETYAAIIRRDSLAEFSAMKKFFYRTVDIVKLSSRRKEFDEIVEKYLDGVKGLDSRVLAEKQYKYIRDFYIFYSSEIHRDTDKLGFDSADLFYYARTSLGEADNKLFGYKYIIAEEDPNGSPEYHDFASSVIAQSKAKIIVIGSTWRMAYMSGESDVSGIYRLRDALSSAKYFQPEYDNPGSVPLIESSGNFMMRDFSQMNNTIKSDVRSSDPFVFLNCESEVDEYRQVKTAILSLHQQRPNDKIVVMARTGTEIKALLKSDAGFRSESTSKAYLPEAPDYEFEVATVKRAKNAIADWVIIIGLSSAATTSQATFWLNDLFSSNAREVMPFREERAAVCSALTRARYRVVLLRDASPERQDAFLDELYRALRES